MAVRRLLGSSALMVSLAAATGGLVAGSGCADPVIIDQIPDGGINPGGGDGGMPSPTGARYSSNPDPTATLTSEGPAAPLWRQWKRDPSFVVDGTTQYLFYAGSQLNAPEKWSIAYYSEMGNITRFSTSNEAFKGSNSGWDAHSVSAPHVIIGSGAEKFKVFYAGDGDSSRPDFVLQIGYATSSDGVSWQRRPMPSKAASAFSSSMADATPTTPGNDAYGATDPFVIMNGSMATMYYAGLNCEQSGCKFQILRATSSDGGNTFGAGQVVLSGRPGVTEEAGGVAGPSVLVKDGKYIMAYTAVTTPPTKSRDGIRKALASGVVSFAASADGITFVNAAANNVPVVGRLAGSYRSEGASSPSLFMNGTAMRVYFTGLIETMSSTLLAIAGADISEVK